MARTAQNRDHGISIGRLPMYSAKVDPTASTFPGAIKLRAEVLKAVTFHAATRVNGSVSSFRTIETAKEVLGEMALRIWRLGYRIEKMDQINGTHIEAVVRDHWACGASPKHFANIMTQLHKFDDWIKKPGMVRAREHYLPEVDPKDFQAQGVAKQSKSWTQNGVDTKAKISEADRKDKRFGLMLRMCLAFGLRRCEVLQIKPWLDDRGDHLDIRANIAKGGRSRSIPVDHDGQRKILDYVKSQITKKEFLGWTDGNVGGPGLLKRNEKRYVRFMGEIGITRASAGVTGHGLRAEYAEDMSLLFGLLPATMGGTKNQMSRDDEDLIRLKVSENMGHSRKSVTGAYYGSLKNKVQNSRGAHLGTIVLQLNRVAKIFTNPIPLENARGEYPKLTKRKLDQCDILVVIDDQSSGMAVEFGEIDFRASANDITAFLAGNTTAERATAAPADAADLARMGRILLEKFGMFLA